MKNTGISRKVHYKIVENEKRWLKKYLSGSLWCPILTFITLHAIYHVQDESQNSDRVLLLIRDINIIFPLAGVVCTAVKCLTFMCIWNR